MLVKLPEILFRAIPLYGYDFVFGSLLTHTNQIVTSEGKVYDIDPRTVGQYIGYTTHEDVKLFQGDIVSVHDFLFDGTEYDHEFTATITYMTIDPKTGAADVCWGLTNISDDMLAKHVGYSSAEEEDWQTYPLPICLINGLHEQSFTVIGHKYF